MSGEEALGPSGTDLELVIKNPARSAEEDFSLRASGDWTVQQLKKQIERAYHGNPNPELQTLIYCGKVLKDPTTKLSSVLGLGQEPDGEERQSTRTLHMVVKQLQPPPSGRSSNRPTGERSVPASASQTPSPADRGAGAIPAPSAQPPPLPVHEHGPPPPPPVGDPPGAAEPAAGGVSPSACAGLEAPSEGYYIMDPVMAAAYNAALAAIIGASSENGAQQHPQWRQPFPFRVAAPSAAFLAPMIPQMMGGEQDDPNQQRGGAVMYPFGPVPYHFQPVVPAVFPYCCPPVSTGAPPHVASPAQHPRFGAAPSQRGAEQAPQAHPGLRAAGGQPGAGFPAAGNGAEGLNPQVRVRLIRINLRALLQLGVFALILYQHCSPSRFFLLVFGGLFLYVTAMIPMRRMLQNLVMGNNQPSNNNNNGGAAGNAAAPGGGFLREVQMLLCGFIASLLPGWNFNPEDAAAFAAAQDIVAGEAAAERDQQE